MNLETSKSLLVLLWKNCEITFLYTFLVLKCILSMLGGLGQMELPSLKSAYRTNEQGKKREYNKCISQIGHGTFTSSINILYELLEDTIALNLLHCK